MKVMEEIELSLQRAEKWIRNSGPSLRAAQMNELLSQYAARQLNIAFCGHFSAGKSSLINALCGKQMLPAGPIPTTANIIRIQTGPEQVSLYKRDQSGELQLQQMIAGTLEHLRAFTTEDTEYDAVKVESPLQSWDHRVVFIDTPGADSTDERHHQATAAALPLADLVLYITDYNHVLSEVNMNALKQLQKMGKPFLFIINQIDKHKEQEIPFQTFTNSVESAMDEWQVNPRLIWYVSTKMPEHPLSEWNELKQWLLQVQEQSNDILHETVYGSMKTIIEQHSSEMMHLFEDEKDALQAGTDVSLDQFAEEMDRIETQLAEVKNKPHMHEHELKQEVADVLRNANIIPALTRDLAHEFLQSQKPGFQKGWLFSKKKTEQEKEDRLKVFHKAIQENIQTQIEIHVKDLLRNKAEQDSMPDTYLNEIEHLDFSITEEALINLIQSGAGFTNEYTMTYANLVSEAVKSKVRKVVFEFIDDMRKHWEKQADTAATEIKKQLDHNEKFNKMYLTWMELNAKEAAVREQAAKLLQSIDAEMKDVQQINLPDKPLKIMRHQENAHAIINQMAGEFEHVQMDASVENKNQVNEDTVQVSESNTYEWKQKNEQTANRLKQAATIIEKLPWLKESAAQMKSKAKRLEQSNFTAALFGAFSAGKSSFANALIGSDLLTVSPHPTTASITRILAPTEEAGHETAMIKTKSADQLMEELKQALSHLGVNEHDVTDLSDWMEREIPPHTQNDSARRSRSFLISLQKGWPEMKDRLGQTFQAGKKDFQRYSAEESRSVYVESIDIHFASPLTDAGIVLVDTPGADSLNARHTGVAFEYIKNADAILFVTYYNHAFTQADRMFLEQLGSVKDQFTLDKMFFIVNAADLANDEDELQQVLEHVKSNLEKCGIRHPHLFPISSVQAQEAKRTKNVQWLNQSGMSAFESSWLRFMQDDIASVSAKSAQHEIDQIIKLLNQWILEAEGEEQEKSRKIKLWSDAKKNALEVYDSITEKWLMDRTKQEISELMFYVKQRLQFKFGDWFKNAFHPSMFQDSAKDQVLASLRGAANELYHLVDQACLQETLTTSLRIETFIATQWKNWDQRYLQQLSDLFVDFDQDLPLDVQWDTPELGLHLQRPDLDDKWLKARFQNAKTFFEQDGSKRMKEEMEKRYMAEIDPLIDRYVEILCRHYEKEIVLRLEKWKNERKHALNSYAESWIEILSEGSNRSSFEEIKQRLMNLRG